MRNITLSTATPTIRNVELAAIRKGSRDKTIGRTAHRTIAPVTYSGTGNVPRYLQSILPNYSRSKLLSVYESVLLYAEQNNSGDLPSDRIIQSIARSTVR